MNKKIELTLADTAGMCYGVNRAVKMAREVANCGGGYTLGELIHNDDVKRYLEKNSIFAVNSIDDITDTDKPVIIRSHGVPQNVYHVLDGLGIKYIDATCPDVKKLHKIIYEQTAKGRYVIIMGDIKHPEIKGVLGHAIEKTDKCFVAESAKKLQELLHREKNIRQNALILMAQTTFDIAEWQDCKKIVKKVCTNYEFFDTICKATVKRQQEAAVLAEKCDLMIVVGGRQSSNSKKLAKICGEITDTIFIENKNQLGDIAETLKKRIAIGGTPIKIGITAGASTPAEIIKEVHNFMNEDLKNGVNEGSDIDFMAEVDRTFKRIYIGNRVKAYVVAVNKTEAVVDVGTKHSGYIPSDELSGDPGLLPHEVVKVGDEIDCIVTSINDAEGVVYLSKKRIDAVLGLESVAKAFESGETLSGVVTSVVKGGVIIVYKGARVFVPASQSGVPRTGKLEDLQKQAVKFKIIEVNSERNRVVGSIRAAIKEELDAKREEFWNKIEVGQRYIGEVKSMESYGVFVDLGGIDGMVHLTELTWNRIKHPKEMVSAGDKLDVYVKSFDPVKRRVSLGVKDPNDNPWSKFLNDFKVGDIVSADVVSITPFGAFAQIIPGVDGLIHISQISIERVTNVAKELSIGQKVECKITEIDEEKTRISLSIKALLIKDEPSPADSDTDAATPAEVLVYSDDDASASKATSENSKEELVTPMEVLVDMADSEK